LPELDSSNTDVTARKLGSVDAKKAKKKKQRARLLSRLVFTLQKETVKQFQDRGSAMPVCNRYVL
jgi:hypothetical protein